MKKSITAFLMIMFIALGGFVLTACGQDNSSDKLLIYTSFYPIYDFARNIGGDKVEVINLVNTGADAHHNELSARQMAGLEKADLIIINGLGMENWLDGLSSSLSSKIVDTSDGVTIVERTTNDNPHYDEDHEEEHEDDGHDHGAHDPHIWLSLKNAVKQMENIKNALCEIDSANANYYNDRFQTFSYLYNGLDGEYRKALEDISNRNIIVAHRAFGYIAYEYDLIQYSLSGIETDSEPTPATLASIIDFINENNITAVFYQTNANAQVAGSIADRTSANLYMLSTLEGLTANEVATGENYYTIMARNLTALVNALS